MKKLICLFLFAMLALLFMTCTTEQISDNGTSSDISNLEASFENDCEISDITLRINVGFSDEGYSFLDHFLYFNQRSSYDVIHPVFGCVFTRVIGAEEHPIYPNRYYLIYEGVVPNQNLNDIIQECVDIYIPNSTEFSCTCRQIGNKSILVDSCVDIYASLNCNELVIPTNAYTFADSTLIYCD
ncbi:hypothetical protein GCM10011344_08360 [Dokdonia pacifica]|uniref:Lipoprotein n=1 Tax=Dokdonia pacifica TaxID=1627892 RepID=A0A238YU60_9FLAO|nr:hypothetical protein [Dokdonia pacifica]GGG10043.1 hypothetical protein GCM10011344_08360 [Dokdonia pacifica]SNR74600.1 hypothetical protein SAMN06265376_102363 [Dokdonia pacifica]